MSTRLAPAPTVEPPATTPLSWRSWRWWVVPLGALALFAVWLRSLDDVAPAKTAGWGLLPALPSSWYGAFAGTILLYLWVLLSRHRIGHTLAALHVVLVSLLFATTAAVYEAPRYPWTYKHIGVVDYLLQHGTVDRSIDIYMNFPAFFYLAAGVHQATGVPVEELARWAQPFHALVAAAAVYWVVGGLSTARRVRYGATLIYTLGDWIGQNYFAPQALAFPVALFVLGGLLRSVPRGEEGFRFAGSPTGSRGCRRPTCPPGARSGGPDGARWCSSSASPTPSCRTRCRRCCCSPSRSGCTCSCDRSAGGCPSSSSPSRRSGSPSPGRS